MLIVGLNGSPNKEGNTKFLLKHIMEKAESLGAETVILDVGEVLKSARWSFCTACSNPCSTACYKGTELEEAFKLLGRADALVLGSPVYFGSMSAQLKAFFDKSRKLRGNKVLYGKAGAAVTVGASRFGGQEAAIKAMHDVMLVQGMNIVGDGFREDDCGHHGVCAQRPAEKDELAIKRCEIIARRLVEESRKQ